MMIDRRRNLAVIVLTGVALQRFPVLRVAAPAAAQGAPAPPRAGSEAGLHFLFEIDPDALWQERLDSLLLAARLQLRLARIRTTNEVAEPENRRLGLRLVDPAELAAAVAALRTLAGAPGAALDLEVTQEAADQVWVRLADALPEEAAERSLAILRWRLQEAELDGVLVEREGPRRIRVTLPRAMDYNRVRGLLLRRGQMTLHLAASGAGAAASDLITLPGVRTGDRRPVQRRPEMDGTRLADARATADDRTGAWQVRLTFDAEGARHFAEVTRGAVGRSLAIVVDGRILLTPVVHAPIEAGAAVISGSFTAREARDLAALLRSGALPAALRLIEERAVPSGPITRD